LTGSNSSEILTIASIKIAVLLYICNLRPASSSSTLKKVIKTKKRALPTATLFYDFPVRFSYLA
jgi:hypothetical protein